MSRRDAIALSGAAALGATIPVAADAALAPARSGPPGFLWGTAISAHQSEGNNVNSDAWLLENLPETVFAQPSADACDSYHRYKEDIALAAGLGFNTHRIGIEWARIEPEPGRFSRAELDHYARVLECCHAHGLAPMVTFNHFSVPRWFAARGGFEMPDAADLFARFADTVARHLGALMAYATTFNEANIPLLLRMMPHPPGRHEAVAAMIAAAARATGSARFSSLLFADPDRTLPVLVDAHTRAVQAIKAVRSDLPVGLTLTTQSVQGVGTPNLADLVTHALYGPWLDVAKTADFVGVQTYTRIRVGASGALPPPEGAEMTAAGYEFYPQALGETIRFMARMTGKPIYVTENGIATNDDSRRVAFIAAALDDVRACLDEGIDVRSYIHWSLLDNFEWTSGYGQHFGLVAVDRASFARQPKPSAQFLGARAHANRV